MWVFLSLFFDGVTRFRQPSAVVGRKMSASYPAFRSLYTDILRSCISFMPWKRCISSGDLRALENRIGFLMLLDWLDGLGR
jgi:hypothetical protein